MFEIGIFCVIFLAVAYWAVLWLMGRREDVLHGEFVRKRAACRRTCAPCIPEAPGAIRAARTPVEARLRNRRSGRNGWSRC
jgi:hypothetical protein